MTRRGVLHAVLADPRIRRLIAAFGLFSLTEYATWLAITVWAFERGGITEAGIAGFAQLAPAAIVAPLAASAGDRFRRDRVLAVSFALVGIASLATGAAMWAEAPAWLVYGAAALTAATMTLARPTMGSLLPGVTDTPAAMTASNVALEFVEALAVFAGPAGAGLLLAWTEPAAVFLVFGTGAVLAAVLAASVRFDPTRVRPTGGIDLGTVHAGMREGFSTLLRDRPISATLGVTTIGFAVIGAADVLFVAVAYELLDGGEGEAGILAAVAGLGGIGGAMASMSIIGRVRLRAPLAFAAVLGGLPLLALVGVSTVPLAALAFFVAGAGWSLLNVTARTLVQRSTPDDVLARVLGVLEGATAIGVAVGSLAIGVGASWLGLGWAIAVTSLVLPVAVATAWPMLGRADARAAAVDPALVDLLRQVDFLAPLGPPAIAQLALNLRPVRAAEGDEIIRMGDVGDRFYVIAEGSVLIHRGSEVLNVRVPGDHIGETALVLDIPRTASVTARESTLLYRLGRETFLEAVTGHAVAHRRAEAVSVERSED